MPASEGFRARQIDPGVLGFRIRMARQTAGLTQAQLAHPYTSTAYISRIEAGQRRPSGLLLERIARRVGLSVDQLLFEVDDEDRTELQLRLGQAAGHLQRGEIDRARDESARVALEAEALGMAGLANNARAFEAAAELAGGDAQRAVDLLEDVIATAGQRPVSAKIYADLCFAYLAVDDPKRAIALAEATTELVSKSPLYGLPESLDLAVAHAQALVELREWSRAKMVAETALQRAIEHDPASETAAAYWDASLAESSRGTYERALRHAERASVLQEIAAFQQSLKTLTRIRHELQSAQTQDSPQ